MGNKKSVSGFKDWLSSQEEMTTFFNIRNESTDLNDEYCGRSCFSKVSRTKLLDIVETTDDVSVIVKEFLKEGGSVLKVEGKTVSVEVNAGTFVIPRFAIKID